MVSPLHGLVDELAMWTEDRRRRAPVGFHPPEAPELDAFGPLPPRPPAPPRPGPWTVPSPRPSGGDASLHVVASPAAGRGRGVAILVPPWKVPSLAMVAGWRRVLRRAGLDVWTVVPPRHLQRSPPGGRSGEAFVSPDLRVLEAALAQAVLELRLLASLARERGGTTAMIGLSLGALAVALAATAPERLDRVALVAPPADLALLFARTRIGRRYAALARRAGAPVPEEGALAHALAPFRAADRRPTAGSVLVAAAREDRIAPCDGALELAKAWGVEPRVYPRGHLTLLFACRAVRRDVLRFLAAEDPGPAFRPRSQPGRALSASPPGTRRAPP